MTAGRHHHSPTPAFAAARRAAGKLFGGVAFALLAGCGSDALPGVSPLGPEPARHAALAADDTLSTKVRASMRATAAEVRAARGHPRFSGVFFVNGQPVSATSYIDHMEQVARDGRVPTTPRAPRGQRRSADGVLTTSCTNDPYAVVPDPNCEVGGGNPIDTTGQGDPPVTAVAPSEWLDVAGTAAIYNMNFNGHCRDIVTKTMTFGRGGFLVSTWHTGSYELGYVETNGAWYLLTSGGIRGIELGSTAESEAKRNTCVPGSVDYRSFTWHNTRTVRYSVARDLLIYHYGL